MATPREYAENAPAVWRQGLDRSPNGVDPDEIATLMERTIKDATREREGKARRQIREAQDTAEAPTLRLPGGLQLHGFGWSPGASRKSVAPDGLILSRHRTMTDQMAPNLEFRREPAGRPCLHGVGQGIVCRPGRGHVRCRNRAGPFFSISTARSLT